MAMVALNFLNLLFMDEALPIRASVSERFAIKVIFAQSKI